MTAFLAIVKLTCRSAVRSHVFRLLLILLLLSIFLLPFTLLGDGTPKGDVQIFLQYCLGFAGFILCLSSVWLACSEVSSDVESAQIHMIAVKPVRRAVVLLGKYTGVVLIHLVLLLIAAAAVYGFLMFRLASSDFSEEERLMLNEQVLTARALYRPVRPDFNAMAQQELERRVAAAKEHGQDVFHLQDEQGRRQAFLDIRKELIATYGLLTEGETMLWQFEGLPKDLTDDDILFLRYTVYVNRFYVQDQNSVRGHWVFAANYTRPDDEGGETVVSDLMALPEEDILTAAQNEMPVPIRPSFFVYDGKAEVGFLNKDTKTSELNFEEGKGPFLLIREAGFFSNYCRAILVLAVGILSVVGGRRVHVPADRDLLLRGVHARGRAGELHRYLNPGRGGLSGRLHRDVRLPVRRPDAEPDRAAAGFLRDGASGERRTGEFSVHRHAVRKGFRAADAPGVPARSLDLHAPRTGAGVETRIGA